MNRAHLGNPSPKPKTLMPINQQHSSVSGSVFVFRVVVYSKLGLIGLGFRVEGLGFKV